jgi:hypothetical protein
MALIHCPECQKEISDKARTCPSCGFPVYRFWPVTERIRLWGYLFIILGTVFITLDIFRIVTIKGGLLLFGFGWLMFGICQIMREKKDGFHGIPTGYAVVVISVVIMILSTVGFIFDNLV